MTFVRFLRRIGKRREVIILPMRLGRERKTEGNREGSKGKNSFQSRMNRRPAEKSKNEYRSHRRTTQEIKKGGHHSRSDAGYFKVRKKKESEECE